MRSPFNISTVWNIDRSRTLYDSLSELNDLGFRDFELAWIPEEKFKTIKNKDVQSLVKGRVKSLHNFVPDTPVLPEGRWKGNAYRLTALEEDERKLAVKYTARTIETAAELGAEAVVIHLGEPVYGREMSLELTGLFRGGLKDGKIFKELREEIIKTRGAEIRKYYETALFSLDEINALAIKRGVKLGLETRLYYEELPGLKEFKDIFARFEGGSLYYWHDMGHARCQEELGFVKNGEYLNAFKSRLIGMHIHDVFMLEDHRAPRLGSVNFSEFTEYFKNEKLLRVFEIHPKSTAGQVKTGKAMLEDLCSKK
ncbi:MAG: TIM barrel protein [Candidatus Firestonebacteria bacterium]